MTLQAKLSLVLPVRDGQDSIAAEVERLLATVSELLHEATELIVVDDGSRDATPEILRELQSRHPELRVSRHSRPRGLEAAGQTGLEKATGEVVFIQESDAPVCLADLRQLHQMSRDPAVVAARAQSAPPPLSGALMRRLKAWGAPAVPEVVAKPQAGMQMIRRPHLQRLASPAGRHLELEFERIRVPLRHEPEFFTLTKH